MGGQWEEGIKGTTIKDTWTEPRGKVEAREGVGDGWGGGSCGGEMQTTVMNNKIIFKKESISNHEETSETTKMRNILTNIIRDICYDLNVCVSPNSC